MNEFFTFWIELFIRPRTFFEKHFSNGIDNPRYFYVALVICGLGGGMDRLDRQLSQADMHGTLDRLTFINTWVGYWTVALIGGTIGAYISYFIGGWFYNVRVKWCKGDDNVELSRNLFLYSNAVHSLVIILIAFVTMFFQSRPYVAEDPFTILDAVVLLVSVFFVYYSIYVSFAGVTTVSNVNWTRAVIWFMVVPAVFYTLLYIAVIGLIYNYFVDRGPY